MKNTRRKFLADLGITVGTVLVGNDLLKALPPLDDDQKGGKAPASKQKEDSRVDFRYAPAHWQSTYCFPDDPYKSLVGKHGELLYGHAGQGTELDAFPHIVTVGLRDQKNLKYVSQHLESPSIPIITTTVAWGEVTAQLTSFATNNKDEGRVDNLLIEFRSGATPGLPSAPEIVIASKSKFVSESIDASSSPRKKFGVVGLDLQGSPVMVVDSPVVSDDSGEIHRFQLQAPAGGGSQPVRFFARFPQEGQAIDHIKERFEEPEKLLLEARAYWQAWQPLSGKVNWRLNGDYQNFG